MRRIGTLLSLGMATAVAVCAGYGCNGPISDWPPKAGGGSDGSSGGKPIGGTPGGGPGGSISVDAGVSVPPGPGSVAGGATPGGASPGGTAAGGLIGGSGSIGGAAGGGTAGASGSPGGGTSTMDSGAGYPIVDAGAAPGDASAGPDSGGIEPDAGDAGWPSDAECSFVPEDAAVVPGADAGVCAAYGCGVTVSVLGEIAKPGAACATPRALAVACSGELSRAAMVCTQENALGLGLGRPVTTCLRRAPQFADVSGNCLQCYADEALCTLSRCFVACIDGGDPACEQCRKQNCGAPFSSCAGIPQAR